MSSHDRGPMNGIIRQANKIVGAVCLSESSPNFIEQFNHCYGGMMMKAEGDTPPKASESTSRTGPQYRPPQHARGSRFGDK
jgi:hypothetical protein